MSRSPVMPIFTDALIGDTTHLSVEEFGAYCLLLFATWRNNGMPFPDDDARLARICRVTKKRWRASLRPALIGFFDLSDAFWRQKRLQKEWKRVEDYHISQRTNGSRGGRPKVLINNDTLKPNGFELRNPIDNPNESSLNLLPSEDKNLPQSDIEVTNVTSHPKPRSIRNVNDHSFDEWWQMYPHKVGRNDAIRKYKIAITKASATELLDGLRRYIASKPPDIQWCHPGTWLHKGRWSDQPATNGHAVADQPNLIDDITPERIAAAAARIRQRMEGN